MEREIISQWNALTPEQQINFCQNCIKKSIKSGRTLKPGYDMDDATQETYCKVLQRLANVDKLKADCQRRDSQGKPDTLAAFICRAANSTMEGISYHHRKDSRATSQTTANESWQELDVLDTIASSDNTETSAIIRAEIRRFVGCLDNINKVIFAGMVDGLTEREIAAEIAISNVAVHKRIAKMKNELIKAIV